MARPGDKVRVHYGRKAIEGILMPNKETENVILKLSTGYNIGFNKDKIKKIEVIEVHKEEVSKKKPAKKKSSKPKISILHTGGTIASKIDYKTGGVVARFSPEELAELFPELNEMADVQSLFLSNMWSEDIRFVHYQLMAEAAAKEIAAGAKGVIITHGTDTMGYTAAALEFVFEELPAPIILVGAQRSSDRPSSDSALNLLSAVRFIIETDFTGVGICMHENTDDNTALILPPTKTRKMHTSRRDAFRAVNDTPIARIGKKIEFLKEYKKGKEVVIKEKFEDRVAIMPVHPNMHPDQFRYYRDFGFRGLIIEGTGLGHAPIGVPNKYCAVHKTIKKELKDLIESGTVVGITSQCVHGRVHMHVYSKGIELQKMGVLSGEDMLTETAFIKLAWLLGNYSPEEAKILFGKNLRGEITERRSHQEPYLQEHPPGG